MSPCAAALVLLLDMSGSVEPPQWQAQVEGHARAFETEAVASAIEREGGIAVRADAFGSDTAPLVGWTWLRTTADAAAFADALRGAGARVYPTGGTYTAAAMEDARAAFGEAPCAAERQIVDVVTDGIANDSARVPAVRDALAGDGIRVNALFVATARGDADSRAAGWDDGLAWLRAEAVTPDGGAWAIEGWSDFTRAIRSKIAWEIAAR